MKKPSESKIPIEAIADAIGRSIPAKEPSAYENANAAENMHPMMQEINICLYPEEIEKRFQEKAKQLFPESGYQEKIYGALNFIREKHTGTYRDGDTLYHYHSMMAAIYCAENGGDITEFLACLIQGVFEKSDIDSQELFGELSDRFGWSVTDCARIAAFPNGEENISEEEYYTGLMQSRSGLLVEGASRLATVYNSVYNTDTKGKEFYYKKTLMRVIPLIESYHPELATKLRDAIKYVEDTQLTEMQRNQLANNKKIREVRTQIGT